MRSGIRSYGYSYLWIGFFAGGWVPCHGGEMSDNDNKIVSLSVAQAEASGSCAKLPVIDLLRELVNEIEAGKIKPTRIACIMTEDRGERESISFAFAGLAGQLETVGFMRWAWRIIKNGDDM